jgi:dihydroneopterin aldolase
VSASDRILVRNLALWAHVGVLAEERQIGQWFDLDLWIQFDLEAAGRSDCLAESIDYAKLVAAIRALAADLCCHTLEHFSERILDCLCECCGPVPMGLELRKRAAPIPGFEGSVAVQRQRP